MSTRRLQDMGKDNRQRRTSERRDRERTARSAGGSPPPPPRSPASWRRGPDPEVSLSQIRDLIDRSALLLPRAPDEAATTVIALRVLSGQAAHPARDPAPTVVADVLASLSQCWERGWQPLDVEHVLRRQANGRSAQWVTEVILAEAAQTAASERAPHAWRAQLDALGDIGRALSVDELLRPAGRATDADWTLTLTVLGWLRLLPATQVLLPRPSAWDRLDEASRRGTPIRGGSRSPDSDPKLLTRIRALLAKAEATDYPAEAEALTAKAQDLMTRHAIDEALVHAEAGGQIAVSGRRIHIDNPYAVEKAILLNGVATANRARAAWSDFAASMTIVGVATDLEQIEMLFTSLLIQATRAMTEAGETSYAHSVNRSSSFRRSFLIAYATRVCQRLDTASDEAAASYGSALVPVFAQREEAIGEEYGRLFPHVRSTVVGRNLNRRGWEAGTDAADRAVMPVGQVGG